MTAFNGARCALFCIIGFVLAGCLEREYIERSPEVPVRVAETESWHSWEYADPMTGHVSAGASSRKSANITPLGFPYDDLTAEVGFVCQSTKPVGLLSTVPTVHAYILFSAQANLADEVVQSRVDDGNILIHSSRGLANDRKLVFGEPFGGLFGSMPKGMLHHLPEGSRWMVRVPWSNGNATFEFDLSGLATALANAGCPEGEWRV